MHVTGMASVGAFLTRRPALVMGAASLLVAAVDGHFEVTELATCAALMALGARWSRPPKPAPAPPPLPTRSLVQFLPDPTHAAEVPSRRYVPAECPGCVAEHVLHARPFIDMALVECEHEGTALFSMDVLADVLNAYEPADPVRSFVVRG